MVGAYMRLDPSEHHPENENERPRKGVAYRMGLSKHPSVSVISSKKKHVAHSGALEATGLSLGVKGFSRKQANHNKRLVGLVDAQAVVGSAAKGRTPAPTTKREIRHVGALIVAGGVFLPSVYVPSEDNPADAPSRGVRRSIHKRKGASVQLRCSEHACGERAVLDAQRSSGGSKKHTKCPGCGALPEHHPCHVANHLRRTGLFCRTPGRFHCVYKNGFWIQEHHERYKHLREHLEDDLVARDLFKFFDDQGLS